MSASVSRRERRALERQADKLFDTLKGAVVFGEGDVVMALEGRDPQVVPLDVAVSVLRRVGIDGAQLQAFASEPPTPRHYACVMLLAGYCELTWLSGSSLPSAGAA